MSKLQLAIQLYRDLDNGQWYVNKVEATRGNVKSKTSFTVPMPLHCVFRSEVTTFLAAHLPVRVDPMVQTVDTRSFERLGILFKDIRVVAQRAFSGLQSVTIRVRQAVGRMLDLYNPELQIECDNWLRSDAPKLKLAHLR